MPEGVQNNQLADGQIFVHKLAHLQGGNHIFLALENKRGGADFFQVCPVIGQEGEVSKIAGYFFVAAAKTLGQLFSSSGLSA